MTGLAGALFGGRKRRRSARTLDTAPGMRWGLITWATPRRQLQLLAEHMPLIRTLVVQAAPSAMQRNLGHTDDYPKWVAGHVVRVVGAGHHVILGLADTAADFADLRVLIGPVLDEVIAELGPSRRRLLAVSLDREWEATDERGRAKYVLGGAPGYVSAVRSLIRDCNSRGVATIGPGGTHSDDKTLPDVLRGLGDLRFDYPSIHWYPDRGWKRAERRIDTLAGVFADHGYTAPLWVGECGVTGQRGWSDDGLVVSADDLYTARFGRMKRILDQHPHVAAALIYQITEPPAPAGEEHGYGFGLTTHDGQPKGAVRYFQPEGSP